MWSVVGGVANGLGPHSRSLLATGRWPLIAGKGCVYSTLLSCQRDDYHGCACQENRAVE